MSYSYVLSLG